MSEIFFGKNLKYLRGKMGVSQSVIGLQVDRKHTSIGNWENNYNEPNLKEVSILANFFGVTIDDLLNTNLETAPENTSETGKTAPLAIKETKVLLIENADMLHEMHDQIKNMRAEYDRRIMALEAKVFLPLWQDGNRVNEKEVVKSKVG